MQGKELRFGSVAAVRNIRHPVTLAKHVMQDTRHCMLTGQGAIDFARSIGMPNVPTSDLLTERESRDGTVCGKRKATIRVRRSHRRTRNGPWERSGAVALDDQGNISAATSTRRHPQQDGRQGWGQSAGGMRDLCGRPDRRRFREWIRGIDHESDPGHQGLRQPGARIGACPRQRRRRSTTSGAGSMVWGASSPSITRGPGRVATIPRTWPPPASIPREKNSWAYKGMMAKVYYLLSDYRIADVRLKVLSSANQYARISYSGISFS